MQVRNSSRIITTPEAIVREFRVADRRIRIESVREPVSIFERLIRIFLWVAFGWAIGYLHHFLAG